MRGFELPHARVWCASTPPHRGVAVTRLVAIFKLILMMTLPLPTSARAAGPDSTADPDSTACLHTARSLLSRKQPVTLWQVDGTRLNGEYLAIDEAARSMSLNAYDPGNDRFGRRDISGSVIERIEWTETKQSMALPIVCVAIFGGLGLAMGLSIQRDPDSGTPQSREKALPLLTGVGVITGFGTGYLLSLLSRESTPRAVDCRKPHGAGS